LVCQFASQPRALKPVDDEEHTMDENAVTVGESIPCSTQAQRHRVGAWSLLMDGPLPKTSDDLLAALIEAFQARPAVDPASSLPADDGEDLHGAFVARGISILGIHWRMAYARGGEWPESKAREHLDALMETTTVFLCSLANSDRKAAYLYWVACMFGSSEVAKARKLAGPDPVKSFERRIGDAFRAAIAARAKAA
jgi:hypothetical protein